MRGSAAPAADATPHGVDTLALKERRLFDHLISLESVVVAFSGGTDSAYLGWAASRALGPMALCVTADSASYPDHHRQLALRVALEFNLRHEFVHTRELEHPDYRANPVNRCYYCKNELYTVLSELAGRRGFRAIVDGNNADDRDDHRPGRLAAKEFGVLSPLDVAGFTKADVRELSRRAGLPTWDEPASACLSSRIPYSSEVTEGKLKMIEQAEAALRSLGFQLCRVRHHGETARIEVAVDQVARAVEPMMFKTIEAQLRELGYRDVAVDPQGYRRGSLNEGVRLHPV